MTRRWRVRRTGWRTVEIRPAAGLGSLIVLLAAAVIAAGMLTALIPRVWAWGTAHPGATVLAWLAAAVLVSLIRRVGRP